MQFLKENYLLLCLFKNCFFYFVLLIFLVFSYSFVFQAAFLSSLFFFHFVFYSGCFSKIRFGYFSFFIAGIFFDLRFGTFLGFYGAVFLSILFLCRLLNVFLRDYNAWHLWLLNALMLFVYLLLRAFFEAGTLNVEALLFKFMLGVVVYPFVMHFYYHIERWVISRIEIDAL